MWITLDSKELSGFFIFRRNLLVDWLYEPVMHFYVGRRKQTFYEGANEVKKHEILINSTLQIPKRWEPMHPKPPPLPLRSPIPCTL